MPVIDRQFLERQHLYGVRQTDGKGNAWTQAMFDQVIAYGQDMVSRDLQIPLVDSGYKLITNERHDIEIRRQWWTFGTHFTPLRAIQEVRWTFGNTEILVFPASWVDIQEPSQGLVQMVPTANAPVQAIPMHFWAVSGGRAQRQIEVDYTAGYNATDVPPAIKQMVSGVAAIAMLGFAGDLILGAGIASSSMSIDGLSQSASTTASAMYGGYSARIEAIGKEMEALRKSLKATEQGFGFEAC
jgi:hypothetical protein